jgi:four helix bundle protein
MEGKQPGHLPIEEMELFRLFDEVSDWCWDSVINWTSIAQRTLGEQLIRAADSVCANLVEGDGRWAVKDGIQFFVIARASARETRLWLRKAAKRKQISEHDAEVQIAKVTKATQLLNNLIRYRRERGAPPVVKELTAGYDVDPMADNRPFMGMAGG